MFTLAIHGGAGTILRELMSAEKEKLYHEALHEEIQCGTKILSTGGSSLDAVEACVRSLENCSLFNAGRGAVFTHQGKNELDASIMEGKNLMAGAVAGVSYIKNPVTLAKTIMQNSEHVLM
jgi:beta-aspartyl-peptidase (threonine type)